MSLEILKEKILNDAKAEAERIKQEAQAEADGIIKEAEAELERLRKKVDGDARRVAEERFQNIVSLARVEGKNQILAVKQRMIQEVFDSAWHHMTLLQKDRFRPFAKRLLALNPPQRDTRLMVGKKSAPMIDEAFIKEVNQELGAPGKFILVENDRGFDYGFYLITDRVEVDLTFRSVLSAVRDKLEMQIITNLFGKE